MNRINQVLEIGQILQRLQIFAFKVLGSVQIRDRGPIYMKPSLGIFLSGALCLSLFFAGNSYAQQDAITKEAEHDVQWCDSIYHQNVSCPGFGYVNVPKSVQKADEAEHLKWCDPIYHQNVGCPKYGLVRVPPKIQEADDDEHEKWCDSIYHQNVGCPKFGQVTIPKKVQVQQNKEHQAWCASINQANVGCPGFEEKQAENEANEAKQKQIELQIWCNEINYAASPCKSVLDTKQVQAQVDRTLSGSKGSSDQRISSAPGKIWGFEQGSWGYSILNSLGVGKSSSGSAN
jgi:hypothetical protein